MEAQSHEDSLNWSCNFKCLLNDYMFNKSTSSANSNQSTCLNFDEYLYWRISSFKDWNDCIHNQFSSSKLEWCLAWRRFVENFYAETSYPIKRYEPI